MSKDIKSIIKKVGSLFSFELFDIRSNNEATINEQTCDWAIYETILF